MARRGRLCRWHGERGRRRSARARLASIAWGLVLGTAGFGCRDKTDPADTATAALPVSTGAPSDAANPGDDLPAAGASSPSARGSTAQSPGAASAVAPQAHVTAEARAASEPRGWPRLEPPDIPRDFCTERVHTLDADACFVLPAERSSTLLIYLHGIVPPTRDSVQKTNFENVVANASERAGVVALIPRGELGFSPKSAPGWWGWPTSKSAYARHGPEFVDKIRRKRRLLEETLAATFERVYLAGSSSGAYFVVAVALHGSMPEIDGFGIISGGSGYRTQVLESLPQKAVYIGFGKHDSVAGRALALGQQLEKLGWPVHVAAHNVAHGAREVYLDEAFAFWQQH